MMKGSGRPRGRLVERTGVTAVRPSLPEVIRLPVLLCHSRRFVALLRLGVCRNIDGSPVSLVVMRLGAPVPVGFVSKKSVEWACARQISYFRGGIRQGF